MGKNDNSIIVLHLYGNFCTLDFIQRLKCFTAVVFVREFVISANFLCSISSLAFHFSMISGTSKWRELSAHDRTMVPVRSYLVHRSDCWWRQSQEDGQLLARTWGAVSKQSKEVIFIQCDSNSDTQCTWGWGKLL